MRKRSVATRSESEAAEAEPAESAAEPAEPAAVGGQADADGPAAPEQRADPEQRPDDPKQPAGPDTPSGAGAGRWLRVHRAATAWTVAWAVALAVFGLGAWSYTSTRGDDALSYGKARDAALADGTRDIARLNTVDSAHATGDLERWLTVTTGPLRDRMRATHAADTATVKRSGTSTRGTVTDAAVIELDTRAGTAKLIATVEVHLTPASGAATTDRKRFEGDLSRTGDGWKLSALTAVPVGSS